LFCLALNYFQEKIMALPRTSIIASVLGGALLAREILRRRRTIGFQGASVIITGGSRGLGFEMARLFGAEGARLTLLARGTKDLEKARRELARSGVDVLTKSCDLRKRADIESAVDYVVKRRGRIDVLVNNAGIVQVGPFEHMGIDDFKESLDVYAWGPLHMIRAVLPHMNKAGEGRIVNITSIGGLVSIPHLIPYCMGKFALVGLSDGLRAELAKDNIRVTTVAPGLMRTGSHVHAITKGQHRKEYAWFSLAASLPILAMSPERAARRIVAACRSGKPRLILTPQARLLQAANALFPGLIAADLRLTARLLPQPTGRPGNRARRGWQTRPRTRPPLWTRLAELAVESNKRMAAPWRS
jgi:NAD(P)-dependent dehydrogenase (short-subunit alcohol dehydrogenase family)